MPETGADSLISEAYDKVYTEEVINNEISEELNNSEVEEVQQEVIKDSEEIEEQEESEEVNESEEKEINLNENLRGVFNKEYIDLLESIEDPKLRSNLIEAGKKQRADLDRKRLELGETKKLVEILDNEVKSNNLNYTRQQYGGIIKNFIGFEALYKRDPKLAIESLAKSANIDLSTFTKPVQQDDYEDDYRLPEEIERDNKLKQLEEKLNQYENQQKQQEALSVQQEVNNFANAKDSLGNLKYPHFDKIRKTMGSLMSLDNNLDMDGAYRKAIRLDDELYEQDKKSLLLKDESRRKQEIEKAKKLKRQSVSSSNSIAVGQNPRKALENIVEQFGYL